jgi:hypothetical protein
MYPFSTKNKASFRIADILHQKQQTDSKLFAQHMMQKNNEQTNKSKVSSDLKVDSNENKSGMDLSPSKSSSPESEKSPEHGGTKGEPMKPTPMYSNFPLPFPLGIHPAFHPAAAYLNYADAIHKGKFNIFFNDCLL